ncbi:Hypothetical protein R9X50_00668700 [Acrodontium crateriforme]|uniref:Zn(2)-C6 fungal-type domain-containing protein n=1 Tax=Acrodontium crateriforme TaxID=150365 RepID=A0AAQ3M9C2_9PEZI|nr:Hypothetical protein R9X50_00668700 [Acrodontium crateriforme]
MTADPSFNDDRFPDYCIITSPDLDSSHSLSAEPPSPGKSFNYNQPTNSTAPSSERSPTSRDLTPASTNIDENGDTFHFGDIHFESDVASNSPISLVSPTNTDDFVFVGTFAMDQRRAIAQSASDSAPDGASSSMYPSETPSVAGSFTGSESHGVPRVTWEHWNNWMEDQHPHLAGLHYPINQSYNSENIPTSESFGSGIPSNVGPASGIGTIDASAFQPRTVNINTHGAFRPDPNAPWEPFVPPRQVHKSEPVIPSQRFQIASNASLELQIRQHQMSRQSLPVSTTMDFDQTVGLINTQIPRHIPQTLDTQAHRQSLLQSPHQSSRALSRTQPYPTAAVTNSNTIRKSPPSHKRKLQPAVSTSPDTPGVLSQSMTNRRGGRERGRPLQDDAREKSRRMRKVGACWRCVLQRDPCPDDGSPCSRCLIRSQKGQQKFFDCDRSKLPDLVHDFLPPSMTLMHQKQSIEDTVQNEILVWDRDNAIDIYLSSGYGPALKWRVHEFRPKKPDLLQQYQFLQDAATGISIPYRKYSPPFGLMKIETSDISHFEQYLDMLLNYEYLLDFGWTCFEEETDINDFQAKMLDLMCHLYMTTEDDELKKLLKRIIRMTIITYIMGHTLTIEENTLPGVLNSVRHSYKPREYPQHTSPRVANRQLKFFFSTLRNSIYEQILNWQQQTLHSSGKKEVTWLPAFCVMLGFAMVLEEVQRTLHIQAFTKSEVGEMERGAAYREAESACGRIDERFNLLIGLFQCKYRDRKWDENGSFGHRTPTIKDAASHEFLQKLRSLLEERRDHLSIRRDVAFAPLNECLYTSRLVARFLLPFLDLST